MRRILVLTAVDVEARGLARRLGLAPVASPGLGRYGRGSVEVACVGLGAGRLEALPALEGADPLVVSAGACGALAPTLRVGDLVVPESVVSSAGVRHATDAIPGLARAGVMVDAGRVLETAEAKLRLFDATGAVAADMESATIVQWARQRGLRAAVVRAVSDGSDRGVPADVAAIVDGDGRTRPGRALRLMLGRPSALPAVLALRHGTSAALDAVAAALVRVAQS